MFFFLRSRDSLHEPALLLETFLSQKVRILAISLHFWLNSCKVIVKHLLMFLKRAQNSNSINLAASVLPTLASQSSINKTLDV